MGRRDAKDAMMQRLCVGVVCGFALVVFGCNQNPPVSGVDAASDDTDVADTDPPGGDTMAADAVDESDGEADTTDGDTAAEDTSDPDSSGEDTSQTDASGSDTGPTDTGPTDTGPADTGNACTGPAPSGCTSDDDCAAGEVCKDDPDSCDPSECTCLNGSWACTDDCGGTVCMPKSGSCSGPDPSGCDSDRDCADDEVCKDDPNSCDPSTCTCTNEGDWACTQDCAGTVCMPKSGSCSGPDPSGCDSDRDCQGGEVCKDDPNSCDPSTCSCSNGQWRCTADCSGTVCLSP